MLENHVNSPLWSPTSDQIKSTQLFEFIQFVQNTVSLDIKDYVSLHEWSITSPQQFWQCVWTFCDGIGSPLEILNGGLFSENTNFKDVEFFPNATLNYAENLLRRRDDGQAIVFWGEDQVKRSITFKELYDQVSKLVQALTDAGLKSGDTVAAYVPHTIEAIVAMLATTALGGIWSSCSPDFGTDGVVERFDQINPKFLFAADYYFYRGKKHICFEKINEIRQRLRTLEKTIIFSYKGTSVNSDDFEGERTISWNEFIAPYQADIILFKAFPFNHPLFILYSSGTTGVPKCIVHGAGGTLIQHLKEHQLHCDIKKNDRVFYFTTAGWMMWNWQISALALGATLLIYEGSPTWPNFNSLFDFAEAEKMTFFGTSAKFIDALRKENVSPCKTHDLSSLRTITSTGSPLVSESFQYVYEHIKQDVHLASISGGTDIISCFVLGNPMAPVWAGEIQTAGLGMAVNVFNAKGDPVDQEKGELVCTVPFPSKPLKFWNDPKGALYQNAYFNRFNTVWHQGDFAEITSHNGFIIYGRSDAVLNPGGVRIGTAEIYRQVEKIDEVLESLAITHDSNEDSKIVLFVKLKENIFLDDDLKARIKQMIRNHTTVRHVPEFIIQIPDIPKTKNGKTMELAVKNLIHGRPITHIEAILNPESLVHFQNLPKFN